MESGIDVVFSFDTTGSMYPCLAEVRRNIDRVLDPLFSTVPGLRVGVIAHGDYCDKNSTYVITHEDLTNDVGRLKKFVNNVLPTGGGDEDECYELVLNRARTLSWTAGKSRVLVMIGDCNPHEPNYPQNTQRLDWRNESKMLAELRVKVYTVQCLNRRHCSSFYQTVADLTGGVHLNLNQFRNVEPLIYGVVYKQDDRLDATEESLRKAGKIGMDLEEVFDKLAGRTAPKVATPKYVRTSATKGLVPVDPSRFQVFSVVGTPSIQSFVEGMGITFKKGRGFYPHISRPETIQEYKEVIIEDLTTGEMFTGEDARKKIGLPYGSRGTVKPNPIPGCRVWVQSTSNNRILREKGFLYEVPDK